MEGRWSLGRNGDQSARHWRDTRTDCDRVGHSLWRWRGERVNVVMLFLLRMKSACDIFPKVKALTNTTAERGDRKAQ
jgi:hypothetical protein